MWDSSYHSVGVSEICKQAGVTKGAFYHHFDTKADLFYAAGHHYWESSKAELATIFSPENCPLEQLYLYIDLILQRNDCAPFTDKLNVEVCGGPLIAAGGQAGQDEAQVRQCSEEISAAKIKYLCALVRGLKGDGLLNGDPDIPQLARLFFQYVLGLQLYGRVCGCHDVMKGDLYEAIYRLLDLKQEYRRIPE